MQNIKEIPQENYPMVIFDTHVLHDRVIFTLPLHATLDTLIPLAVDLLHMPDTCKLLVRLAGEDGELAITFGRLIG
jgi:hypothetical protein